MVAEPIRQSEPLLVEPVPSSSIMERVLLVLLLLGFIASVGMVLLPFATALMFGSAIAVALWPLRRALTDAGWKPATAATILILAIVLLSAMPMFLIIPALAGDVAHSVDLVRNWLLSSPPPPDWLPGVPVIGGRVNQKWLDTLASGEDLSAVIVPYVDRIRATFVDAARAASESLLQFLMALIVATMFWAKGDRIAAVVLDVLNHLGGPPLAQLAPLSANAARGVFYGVIGTAALQALFMGGGLGIAGVPGAIPLGFITLLLALSQIGGVLLHAIWIGACVWLHLNGASTLAVWSMGIWGFLVTMMDQVMKPWLIGTSIKMPMPLIIIGVFGGFLSFGFLGLFVGPVLIAIAYALLGMWSTLAMSDTP